MDIKLTNGRKIIVKEISDKVIELKSKRKKNVKKAKKKV